MKKSFKILFLLAAGIITGITANAQETVQQTEEFKPSGKPIVLIFANINHRFSDGENVTAFEINRGFLGYEHSFSKEFSAKIVYEASGQAASGKSYFEGYLRNAHLQYSTAKVTVRGGLISPEQLSVWEKQWNCRYITRPYFESSGMIFSSDLGIAFKYKPTDNVAIDFSVTNGRGSKDLAPDTTLRYDAGITIFPVKNLIFRGYFDIKRKYDISQWTMSLSAAYIGPKFTLSSEYYSQNNHQNISGQDYTGFNIFSSVKIAARTTLFGYYDYLFSETIEGGTDAWNINKDGGSLTFGIDFKPVNGVRMAPNFKYLIPASGAPGTGIIGFHIEAKI